MYGFRILWDKLEFTFYHRINVIGGEHDIGVNSSTYKTKFYNDLRNAFENNEQSCNYDVIFVSDVRLFSQYRVNDGVCFIIDEVNLSSKSLNDVYETIKEFDTYLLIAGRSFISDIPFTVDAIFSFNLASGRYYLYNSFGYESGYTINKDWYSAVEDSINVANYYNKRLENSGSVIRFQPANGKDKLLNKVSRRSKSCIIGCHRQKV